MIRSLVIVDLTLVIKQVNKRRNSMVEKNNQTNGESQIEEMILSFECEQELGEEELAEVSGAGIGNAMKGWSAAGAYGGDLSAKASSAWHGLTNSGSFVK